MMRFGVAAPEAPPAAASAAFTFSLASASSFAAASSIAASTETESFVFPFTWNTIVIFSSAMSAGSYAGHGSKSR